MVALGLSWCPSQGFRTFPFSLLLQALFLSTSHHSWSSSSLVEEPPCCGQEAPRYSERSSSRKVFERIALSYMPPSLSQLSAFFSQFLCPQKDPKNCFSSELLGFLSECLVSECHFLLRSSHIWLLEKYPRWIRKLLWVSGTGAFAGRVTSRKCLKLVDFHPSPTFP